MVVHITEKPEGQMKGAIITSFVIAALLVTIKFLAYILTGSAAILSDAAESIINVMTAGFGIVSLFVSFRPPDDKHPYGHGKIEFFSAAFEGGAIIVAAIFIIYHAIGELVTRPVIQKLDTGIWLIVASIVINTLLGLYLLYTGKKGRSLVLEADGRHVLTDVITSVGVIGGLVVMYYTKLYFLDSLIAVIVATSIMFTGVKLLKKAGVGMMDASDPEEDAKIKIILDAYHSDHICSYHKVRHRHSGNMCFVDFHLIVPANLPIGKAHEAATKLELQIAAALGDASVMAHIEPCRDQNCPNCNSR